MEMDTFVGHMLTIKALAISQNDGLLFSGSSDYEIKLWNIKEVRENKVEHSINVHDGQIKDIKISKDGDKVFSCSEDKTVRVRSLSDYKELAKLEGHEATVTAIAINNDSSLLCSVA